MNPAENYILEQPEPFRSILLHLQVTIENTVPEIDLLYKYKIPFYYIEKKPFCYLNHTKGYVDLGFWNAAHLSRHVELMISKDRKYMRSLRYYTMEDIDQRVLEEVLIDAFMVKDKRFYK